MKWDNLLACEWGYQIYEKVGGMRTQYWPQNDNTDIKYYPGIQNLFETNLDVAKNYITWNT